MSKKTNKISIIPVFYKKYISWLEFKTYYIDYKLSVIISLVASAWDKTEYDLPNLLNLTHTLMCSVKAFSSLPPFFSISWQTASAHNPQTNFPENLSRARSFYELRGALFTHATALTLCIFYLRNWGEFRMMITPFPLLSSSSVSLFDAMTMNAKTSAIYGKVKNAMGFLFIWFSDYL